MASPRFPPLSAGDLVLSDFDGTIARVDVGVEVITRLDLTEAWDLEFLWRRGEIGSRECLAAQWALVRLSAGELEALLASMPLDHAFPDFARACRRRGAALAVLSDGLDLYAYPALRRLGLEPCPGTVPLPPSDAGLPVFINHGEWTPQGVRVTYPYPASECGRCGNCKTHHLLALKPRYRRIIYVGDGHSDDCPVHHADVIFAREYLAEFCRAEGLPYLPFDDFRDVREALDGP